MFPRILAAAALLFGVPALADVPVGSWSEGEMALSMTADGRFDWRTGSRHSEGSWTAGESLVSMQAGQSVFTYAFKIRGDQLTLTDVGGGRIVLQRDAERPSAMVLGEPAVELGR